MFPLAAVVAVSMVFVLLLVSIISYGFELYSKYTGHGHYELMDAVASIVGGVLGMLAVLVVKCLVKNLP